MWRKVEFRRCVLKFKERRFTGFLSVYDDCVKMFLCRYLHNYHWCWGKSHGVSISTSWWQWRGCGRRGHTSHFNVEEENIADYDFDAYEKCEVVLSSDARAPVAPVALLRGHGGGGVDLPAAGVNQVAAGPSITHHGVLLSGGGTWCRWWGRAAAARAAPRPCSGSRTRPSSAWWARSPSPARHLRTGE